jgi:hypothetical protein
MPMTEVPPVTELIPNELNYATDARRTVVELISNPDFLAVLGLAMIGGLASLYLAASYPATDQVLEFLGQFP